MKIAGSSNWHVGCSMGFSMPPSSAPVATHETARPTVVLLEARMKSELARLVEKHGGAPVCVPAVREATHVEAEAVAGLLDELETGRHEVVIFMTGVAVSLLFELTEQLGRRAELVAALRRVTTVCRGPKPTAALRGFGVPPTVSAREPFTAAELIDSLSDLEISGRGVLLFNYGERSETLSETLLARRADLREFWLYRWQMPADTTPLEQLVRRIVDRDVSALAITCQIQFRHLYQVAERLDLGRELVDALRSDVVVAAVGPTCKAILEVHGVRVQVMPEHPKMGPLVMSLMRHLSEKSSAPPRARVSRLSH
ncbi:MAG TPA: uroporphyrinogen-III synthase [Polyangiaceae bacterium]|nr:uroporphyrinogen-III synthase [Polyangiaceae bacterium]